MSAASWVDLDALRQSGLERPPALNIHILGGKLSAWASNEDALEAARERLSRTPPTTPPLGSTRPGSHADDDDWQRTYHIAQRSRLIRVHNASRPAHQFEAQTTDPIWRLLYHIERGSAQEAVKAHWFRQGIWKDEWTRTGGRAHRSGRGNTRSPQAIAGATDIYEDQDASRPFFQFLHQLALASGLHRRMIWADAAPPSDINTDVYRMVQDIWERHRIWNPEWGTLPGLSWTHEMPLGRWLKDRMGTSYVDSDGQYEPGNGRRLICDALTSGTELSGDSDTDSTRTESQEDPDEEESSTRSNGGQDSDDGSTPEEVQKPWKPVRYMVPGPCLDLPMNRHIFNAATNARDLGLFPKAVAGAGFPMPSRGPVRLAMSPTQPNQLQRRGNCLPRVRATGPKKQQVEKGHKALNVHLD
ncbi:hypothetical protein BDW74DRAFT_181256 [Aspergillus multicolor]|uniref:uncharacterized protein n=1 Tax=Aspergillus multicolor TaxID=41759 RepID=UPI003CCD3A32